MVAPRPHELNPLRCVMFASPNVFTPIAGHEKVGPTQNHMVTIDGAARHRESSIDRESQAHSRYTKDAFLRSLQHLATLNSSRVSNPSQG